MKRLKLKYEKSFAAMLITYLVRRIKEFMFMSDYDPVQFFAGIVSVGCGIVLATRPEYMTIMPSLQELLAYAPQRLWMYLLLVGGGTQLFVFLLSGCPGFFCKDGAKVHDKVIRWYIGSIVVEIGGLAMYGALAILLSLRGVSWGTILFGTTASGCLWASWRLGSLIAAEQEYKRQRNIREGFKAAHSREELADFLRQYRI